MQNTSVDGKEYRANVFFLSFDDLILEITMAAL